MQVGRILWIVAVLGGVRAGSPLSITVFGGVYRTTLSPREAREMGISAVTGGGDNGESEVEVDPSEPVDFSTGAAAAIDLTEGDRVLLFLAASGNDQIGPSLHVVGSGQGAFVGAGAQVRRAVPGAAPATFTAATIRRLAASIDEQKGPALDVQNLPSDDSTASAAG